MSDCDDCGAIGTLQCVCARNITDTRDKSLVGNPSATPCGRNQHQWHLVRNGKRQECSKCGDCFPCRHICKHLDCADARKEMLTNERWFDLY